ncbi:MAG: restriction endonuclease subunit S [Pirellulaceae bacterium]
MANRQLVELDRLADFRAGGTPPRTESSFWGGDVPWISGKDFKQFRVRDSQERLTEEGAERATLVPAGSTLVLVRGMMLANTIPVMFTERTVAFNQDVRAIVPRDGILPEYLAYAIQARVATLHRFVTYSGHGTARLESDFIKALPVWKPTRIEQSAVVSVLRRYDASITVLNQRITAGQRRQQRLSHAWLTGETRFPSFSEIPWISTKLGALFSNRRENGQSGLPTFSVTMHRGLVSRSSLDRRMKDTLPSERHLLVRPGDIVYNMMRMWQGASGRANSVGIVSPAYIVLAPRPQMDSHFAAHWFKSAHMVHRFWAFSYGLTGDRLRLYFKDFSKIPVRIPTSLDEQRAIAEALDTTQCEIDLLKELRDQIQQQKRGLMQKLLTGQIRVKEAAHG